jgi:hypothetical protein
MKVVFGILALLVSLSASAATINDGSYNAEKKAIELSVSYGGGCKEHTFKLDIGPCMETNPVMCHEIQLLEDANGDACEAYVTKTIYLPLSEVGLSDSYYAGAMLVIHGDQGSQVEITLP